MCDFHSFIHSLMSPKGGGVSSSPGFSVTSFSVLQITNWQLSTEMTARMWSCLRSFSSLNHLSISDSSFGFSPFPPELLSVTKLSTERVTSQCYKVVLSSLPGLKEIDITIDDAERDIPQIMACLRQTGGLLLQLTHITIKAPSGKNSISRETMRGLGLLITDQTKNLQVLELSSVKCRDEEDLINLIGMCSYVKTMSKVW